MANKTYTVNIGGIDHTMELNEADAKRYGKAAVPVSQRAKAAPSTKAASTPKNKSGTPAANKKAASAPDKSSDESAETDW